MFLSLFVLLLLKLLLLLFCFFLASDIFVIKALYFYVENQIISLLFCSLLSFFFRFISPSSLLFLKSRIISFAWQPLYWSATFLSFFFLPSFLQFVCHSLFLFCFCLFLSFFLSFFCLFLFVCLFFVFTQESVEFDVVWAQDTTPDEGGVPVNYRLC